MGAFDDLVPQQQNRFADLIPPTTDQSGAGRPSPTFRPQPTRLTEKVPGPLLEGLVSGRLRSTPTVKQAIQERGAQMVGRAPETFAQAAKPATVAAGATAGALQGGGAGLALGGPVGGLAGAIVGAMAGAGGGSLVFDTLNEALDFMTGKRLPGTEPTGQGKVESATKEAMFEGAIQAGVPVVGFPVKHFLMPLLGKMLGVRNEVARELVAGAARQGINLGAVDVGNAVARNGARVLGVFPFTGTPLVKAERAKIGQLHSRLSEILNEMAPTASLANEVGIDLAAAARESHLKFRTTAAALYEDGFKPTMRAVVDAEGNAAAVIPTTALKKSAGGFIEDAARGEIPGISGLKPDKVDEFIAALGELPDNITFDQWRGLKRQFQGILDSTTVRFDIKRASQLKAAMESDLRDMTATTPEMQALIDDAKAKLSAADKFFAANINRFKTETAQDFLKADKRMFGPGPSRPGSINEDQLVKSVFDADSPTALRELRELVGPETFNKTRRLWFESVIAKSRKFARGDFGRKVEMFDIDSFAGNLGLGEGIKGRRAAIEEMLRGTNVSVADLEELIRVANIAKVNDPSAFVMRRVTLGGVRAITGALGIGAAVASGGHGLIAGAVMTLAGRAGSHILADPTALKAMTTVLTPTLPEVQRRAILIRLLRVVGETMGPDQAQPE